MEDKPNIKKTKEINDTPKKLKIHIEDATTGEVYADYITDIAIIGAVNGTRDTADPEKTQQTNVFYIGSQAQIAQMLFYVANEIGKNMEIVLSSKEQKAKNPDTKAN